jgi:hypothetical protein
MLNLKNRLKHWFKRRLDLCRVPGCYREQSWYWNLHARMTRKSPYRLCHHHIKVVMIDRVVERFGKQVNLICYAI